MDTKRMSAKYSKAATLQSYAKQEGLNWLVDYQPRIDEKRGFAALYDFPVRVQDKNEGADLVMPFNEAVEMFEDITDIAAIGCR